MSGEGKELAWDASIADDGKGGWTLLPPGEYPFRVLRFERARYQPRPGAKLPACNQAKLTVEIAGSVTVNHNLYLHTSTEGLLCAFFKSIGQRQHGERVVMDWGKVPGATGRCKVKICKWKGRDEQEHESNEIERFLDPAATGAQPVPAAVQPAPPDAGPDDSPF